MSALLTPALFARPRSHDREADIQSTTRFFAVVNGDPEPFQVENKDCTLIVRSVALPSPRWEIVRWEVNGE